VHGGRVQERRGKAAGAIEGGEDEEGCAGEGFEGFGSGGPVGRGEVGDLGAPRLMGACSVRVLCGEGSAEGNGLLVPGH
jgi:hypothetical protein